MKKDATDLNGKTFLLTVEGLAGKEGTLAVNEIEAAFDYKAPEITGVTVKGAQTIEVAFNEKLDAKTVNADAFDVKKVTGADDADVQSAVLNADGKTVTIVVANALTVANYSVTILDQNGATAGTPTVTDVAGNATIVGTEATFKPTAEQVSAEAAPTVIKSSYDIERGQLTVQFDKNIANVDVTKLAINDVALVAADTVNLTDATKPVITLSKETKEKVAALTGELTLKAQADAVEAADESVLEAGSFAIETLKPATVTAASYNQEARSLTVTFDKAVKIKDAAKIYVNESDATGVNVSGAKVAGKDLPAFDKQTAATTWTFELAADLAVVDVEKLKVFLADSAVETEDKLTNAAVAYENGVKVAYTKDVTAPTVQTAELFHTSEAAGQKMELRLTLNEKVKATGKVTLAIGEKADEFIELTIPAGAASTAAKTVTVEVTGADLTKVEGWYANGKAIKVAFAKDVFTDENTLKNAEVKFDKGIALTVKDYVAPTLGDVTVQDKKHIQIQFSEIVDQAAANVTANYAITDGTGAALAIESVLLLNDGKTVLITTAEQAEKMDFFTRGDMAKIIYEAKQNGL